MRARDCLDPVKPGVVLIPHGTPAQSLLQLEGAPKIPAGKNSPSKAATQAQKQETKFQPKTFIELQLLACYS